MRESDSLVETLLEQLREFERAVASMEDQWRRAREALVAVLDRLHDELGEGTGPVPSTDERCFEFDFLKLPCFARFTHSGVKGWVEYGVHPKQRGGDRPRVVVQRVEFVPSGNTTDGSGLSIDSPALHIRTLAQNADELFQAFSMYDGTGYMRKP